MLEAKINVAISDKLSALFDRAKKKTPEISQCSNRKTFGQNVHVVFVFFLIKDIVVYLREH